MASHLERSTLHRIRELLKLCVKRTNFDREATNAEILCCTANCTESPLKFQVENAYFQ